MAKLHHTDGLVEAVLELGFDNFKYFEINATGTAQKIVFSLPARRLVIFNRDVTNSVFINTTGANASISVGAVPGDNIRVRPGCQFTVDFDSFNCVSLITAGSTVEVDGLIGWKATVG